MKTTYKLIFFLSFFVCFTAVVNAQTQGDNKTENKADDQDEPQVQESKYPEDVIIRMIEWHNGTIGDKSKLITIKADNSVEVKDLEKSKFIWTDLSGMTSNLSKLRTEIQKWHNYGYTVKSSSSSSIGENITMTNVIMEKN